jgi:DNA repair protein RecN (Recombination protein N)
LQLGLFLIDIHSQQQTQELSDENVQFKKQYVCSNNEVVLEYQSLLKKQINLNELCKKSS